jgi:hypothetical protein
MMSPVCMQVAGGPPEHADQEADRDAWGLDQYPGDHGGSEDTGGPLLGRRGQRHRQLGLQTLWPCKISVILLDTTGIVYHNRLQNYICW